MADGPLVVSEQEQEQEQMISFQNDGTSFTKSTRKPYIEPRRNRTILHATDCDLDTPSEVHARFQNQERYN
jgi:hypothetical protein